jgi:hypothetical protein
MELLDQLIIRVPNTNKICVHYPVFQRLATEANYATIIQYMEFQVNRLRTEYDSIEVHLNLNLFTISSLTKYYRFIEMFIEVLPRIEPHLSYFHVYYTPTVIEQLLKIFKRVRETSTGTYQTVFYNTKESPREIGNLLGTA